MKFILSEMNKHYIFQGSDIPQYMTEHNEWRRMTEPPLTINLTEDELRQFVVEPLRTGHPSHTQIVERMVRITSIVTAAVSGHYRQIGEGLAKLKGTSIIPRRIVRKQWLKDYILD